MGAEPCHLAASVRCQLQDLMQPCQLACFAVEGTSVQGLGHSVEFLDYSNGDILRGRDLQFVDPSVVAEALTVARGRAH